MTKVVWYELKSLTNLNHIQILTNAHKVVKIDLHNFNIYKDIIESSILKFNSEIEWDGMWDIQEAHERLLRKNTLYLFLKDNSPIGHVWYIGEYLFNAFVSRDREDGESQWFIQQTIHDIFKNGYTTITLYTEEWNKRAIGFWEKLGFSIINKNELIEYGREYIHKTQGND